MLYILHHKHKKTIPITPFLMSPDFKMAREPLLLTEKPKK